MLKVCSRCKQEKSVSEFYKRKSSKDGYDSWCKKCSCEGRNRENYLAKKKARYAQNADALRKEKLQYYYEHKEQESIRAARYYQEHKDRLVNYSREYREVNRGSVNQKRKNDYWANPEKDKAYHRAWSKSHPEKTKIHNCKRRARINGASGHFTAKEFEELCAKYDWRCLACGEQKPLSPDHVIPISRGGSNDISNIQPLCRSCNCKKHARTIDYRKP